MAEPDDRIRADWADPELIEFLKTLRPLRPEDGVVSIVVVAIHKDGTALNAVFRPEKAAMVHGDLEDLVREVEALTNRPWRCFAAAIIGYATGAPRDPCFDDLCRPPAMQRDSAERWRVR